MQSHVKAEQVLTRTQGSYQAAGTAQSASPFLTFLILADTCRRQLLLLSLFWYEAIKAKGKVMCQAQAVRK